MFITVFDKHLTWLELPESPLKRIWLPKFEMFLHDLLVYVTDTCLKKLCFEVTKFMQLIKKIYIYILMTQDCLGIVRN